MVLRLDQAVRLRAVRTALDLGLRYRQAVDVEARLAEVQALLADDDARQVWAS